MKKFLLFTTLFSTLLFAQVCLAAPKINELTPGIAEKGGYEVVGVDDTSLSRTVGSIIKIALSLIGTIFVALTVYAGFLWMTAGGEDEKVTKARDILQAAVIGLAITLAAYSITYFVTGAMFSAQQAPTVVGGEEPPVVPPVI